MTCLSYVEKIKLVAKLPRVRIVMSGGEQCKELHRFFTSPHPRVPLLANKRWGAALMPTPNTLEEFLKGKPRQVVRTARNKCVKLGYAVRRFQAVERIDDMLEINGSMSTRQEVPILPDYLDRDRLTAYARANPTGWGCFDAAGKLRAYCFMVDCGEVAIVSRLMGHGAHVDDGVMYFLLAEMIGDYAQRPDRPAWLMYDMYLGAKPGLRYFKDRMGFSPHNVKWVWR